MKRIPETYKQYATWMAMRFPDEESHCWAQDYGWHPAVLSWLRSNPPPSDWPFSPLVWAYCEAGAVELWWKRVAPRWLGGAA